MTYKLSDISSFISIKMNIKDLTLEDYISTENMLPDKGGVVLSSSLPSTSKTNSFKKGDVLFSNIRTYFRKVWFATFDGGVSNDVLVFRSINENILNNKYLYYLLSNESFIQYTVATAKGTKMPRGDKFAIMNYECKLPSLETQEKIVDILSTFDAKIELNSKMNQTLEEIAQTLFKSWFVDFDPVHSLSNKTDSDFERVTKELGISKDILEIFPSEFEESELGMIPKGWKIYNFIDLVKHLKPGTNYQPKRIEKGIPFTNGKHILNSGFLKLDDAKLISNSEYERVHKSWKPDENDILITRIGTLGKVGVITKEDLPMALHYNIINIKEKDLSYQYLYFLLKSDFFQKQFHLNKKQAVQEFITIDAVEKIKIILPTSEDLTIKLSKDFNILFEKIKNNHKNIISLQKTRDTLLPKLLNGEIDISTVNELKDN